MRVRTRRLESLRVGVHPAGRSKRWSARPLRRAAHWPTTATAVRLAACPGVDLPPRHRPPTLCPGAQGAGRRLRHWQVHARLHPARYPCPPGRCRHLTHGLWHPHVFGHSLSFGPSRFHSGLIGWLPALLRPLLTLAPTCAVGLWLRRCFADHPQGEISPGKNALLRCTTAGFTPPRLDHERFAEACPLAQLGNAFYPVLVHRLAASLHASSPHSVAFMQLRFASFAVINLRQDLHPQECARAGRTN